METATVQQAESSASRHRLAASLPTRGVGTHQTNRSTRSPLQPPSAAQEATSAPRLDLAPAPHRPLVCKRLVLNQDARFNGGRGKGKAKREDQDESPSMQRGKKNRKDHRRLANSMLVAMTDHMDQWPQQGLSDHFNELMKSPCTNHAYPIKHLYKDCELLKRLLR